ncbi:MAG: hypothetical protein Q9163_003257 [Psora crenata]
MASPATRPTTLESSFAFPKSHAFPPFYTLQPNHLTRQAQYQKWSRTIQLYCRHHRLFCLQLPSCLELPLFKNQELRKRLGEKDARQVLDWMASDEGARRGQWIAKDDYWVYWKRPEEWGDTVHKWVEGTGQKGVVLTFYELLHGESTSGEDFHNMDTDLFAKAMNVLVKKGKAQVFGDEDSRGVKFF